MVLVGVAMDDRGLDLATDPAIGPDRHAAAQVRPEELRVGADRARAFDPRKWLHPDVGGREIIGPLVVSNTV